MQVEIDETQFSGLFETDENGKNVFNPTKIKTESDVSEVLKAKAHANEEIAQLKEKYKNVDLNRYQNLLNQELEANKDILTNPVYKNLQNQFSDLNSKYENLQSEITKRDQAIIDQELKDIIRNNNEIQTTAVDDIFYRLKQQGFTKTDKGFLNINGETVDVGIEKMKNSAKHLFKMTQRSSFNAEQVNSGIKNNKVADVFAGLSFQTKK